MYGEQQYMMANYNSSKTLLIQLFCLKVPSSHCYMMHYEARVLAEPLAPNAELPVKN